MEAAKLQSCSGAQGCGNGVMAMGIASRSERDLEWVAGTLVLESACEVGVSTLLLDPNFQAYVFPERGGRSVGGKSYGKIQAKFLTSWQKGGEKTPKWEVSLQSSMDSSGRGREAGNVHPEPLCDSAKRLLEIFMVSAKTSGFVKCPGAFQNLHD